MSKRSKVELQGLLERVVDEYTNKKKTIVEIEEGLRNDGYDISRESIRRSLKSSKETAMLYKQSLDEAKVLLDTVRENPNTDVIEVTNSLLARKLFEYAKSIEELDFEKAEDFIASVQRLGQVQVQIAKLRLSFQNGVERAKQVIMESLAKELEGRDDLLHAMSEIVAKVEVKEK